MDAAGRPVYCEDSATPTSDRTLPRRAARRAGGSGRSPGITCHQEPPMSTPTPRHAALRAITGAAHKLDRVNFREVHVKDIFGANVFSEAVQRERLPKPA